MPDRERARGYRDEQEARGERPLRADAPADQAGDRACEQQCHRARQEVEAGFRRAGIKAEVDVSLHGLGETVRDFDKVRHEHERAEHREAGHKGGHVREQHLPHGQHAHVDHRLRHAQLRDSPGHEEDGCGCGEAEDPP